jgi:hypothetical protein
LGKRDMKRYTQNRRQHIYRMDNEWLVVGAYLFGGVGKHGTIGLGRKKKRRRRKREMQGAG